MNKKGFVLSTYVYILLVFFLLLLGTMLTVLNNSKLLSNKLKEQSGSTSGLLDNEYSFVLLGNKEMDVIKDTDYEEPGYIAKTTKGVDISTHVSVIGNVDTSNENEYTLTYKITYNGVSRVLKRIVNVITPITEFAYTGDYQVYEVPATGYYKVETWGAQGGGSTGGYGGYSVGNVYLNEGAILYINVGENAKSASGGYNGGGSGGSSSGYGGGGATHIALKSGEIFALENYKDNILIVAGGGGGADNWSSGAPGGHGGGHTGGAGSWTGSTSMTWSLGGTQASGGVCNTSGATYTSKNGTFGVGGNGATWGGGGGGGYYGGSGGNAASDWVAAGGGGSGYIANPLLTNKVMYCYDCEESQGASTKTITTTNVSETPTSNYAKSGDGHARITYLGKNY